jgi:hypothetical protein
MPDYRRNRVSSGTFFFTVNLLDRRSNLLVRYTDALRAAVRRVRARRDVSYRRLGRPSRPHALPVDLAAMPNRRKTGERQRELVRAGATHG